jgi:hypothetical protein
VILETRVDELVVVPLEDAVVEPDAGLARADRHVDADDVFRSFPRQQQKLSEVVYQARYDEVVVANPIPLHAVDDL